MLSKTFPLSFISFLLFGHSAQTHFGNSVNDKIQKNSRYIKKVLFDHKCAKNIADCEWYRYMFRSPLAALSINWWIQSSTLSNILSSGYDKCFPVTLDPICPCWIWLFVHCLHFYLRFLYFCRLLWTLVHLCVETLRSYFFCWEWTVRWLIFTPVLHWWWTHEYCIWSQQFDHYSSHIMFL